MARIQHITSIDGRPLHTKSQLQVTESSTECSSLFVTDTVYADVEWPPDEVDVGRLSRDGFAYTSLVLDGGRLEHRVTHADVGEVNPYFNEGPDLQSGQTFERTRPQ